MQSKHSQPSKNIEWLLWGPWSSCFLSMLQFDLFNDHLPKVKMLEMGKATIQYQAWYICKFQDDRFEVFFKFYKLKRQSRQHFKNIVSHGFFLFNSNYTCKLQKMGDICRGHTLFLHKLFPTSTRSDHWPTWMVPHNLRRMDCSRHQDAVTTKRSLWR